MPSSAFRGLDEMDNLKIKKSKIKKFTAQSSEFFKVLMIDNFDSFTYNLVDEFEKRNCEVSVYRNNISMKNFEKIIEKINPCLKIGRAHV